MLRWIIGILVALLFFKYGYLIIKRLTLIAKLKRNKLDFSFVRNPIFSVFRHDGKVDLIIQSQAKKIAVTVLTTPYRKVRYYFFENKRLEIILERRGVFVMNPRAPGNNAAIDHVFTIRKYKIHFDNQKEADCIRYVVLHPAPRSVSKSKDASLVALGDNDLLFEKIKICGLKWFLSHVIYDD
ncbi:MAG: hypothetical protein IJW16_04405 [Clostridia bacterium]|nr:hypothetical protein [Clostridia bacterium]